MLKLKLNLKWGGRRREEKVQVGVWEGVWETQKGGDRKNKKGWQNNEREKEKEEK